MARIVYLDQRCLFDDDIWHTVNKVGGHDWHRFRQLLAMESTLRSVYPRAGTNNLPFSNSWIHNSDHQIPEWQEDFDISYSDITDQRCWDLVRGHDDRAWIVCWSGGIDSTTVVCSLLRNLPATQRRSVTVAMNSMSVYENPHFYLEVIKPNFQVQLIEHVPQAQEGLVINGHPNDQLFPGGFQPFAMRFATQGHRSWRSDPDGLIEFLTGLADRDFATWFYDRLGQNILSTELPIVSYSQFWWWWFFNHMWLSVSTPLPGNTLAWFASRDYQQWSLHHNLSQIRSGEHVNYKQEAKDYIQSVWPDAHYHAFKTKYHSGSLATSLIDHAVLHRPRRGVWALLDDGTYLQGDQSSWARDLVLDHVNI